MQMGNLKPWVLRNSAQLIPMVHAFNMRRTVLQAFSSPPFGMSWDFERLFTSIPQIDLKAKLDWIIDRAFDQHLDRPTVRVRKDAAPMWRSAALPQQRHGRDVTGVQFFTFDRQTAKQAIHYLIDHAYVRVGDRIYHQLKGIPMGTIRQCILPITIYLPMSIGFSGTLCKLPASCLQLQSVMWSIRLLSRSDL